MSKQGRIFSGMRPTQRLTLGNYKGALENWVRLQDDYECFYCVVDWHALTTGYQETADLRQNIRGMVIDWLAAGIDPGKSVVFVQSHVKEHAELHLLFSMITPLGWVERVPTYKEQLRQLEEREINTYGFLGYPVLQAADIVGYRAGFVPVGEDQLPHLELCREIVRRFNFLYHTSLPEPQALLSKVPMLPGIDGRKMSKSYGNAIWLSASAEEVQSQVQQAITDPAKIRKNDPGHPEVCNIFTFHRVFSTEVADVEERCRAGSLGCVACKRDLAGKLNLAMEPMRERRARLESRPGLVDEVIEDGRERAHRVIARTMEEVRAAVGI